MNPNLLRALAMRLHDSRTTIPEPAMASARMHFLDALCVGIAGSAWGSATEVAKVEGAPGPCSILGADRSTAPEIAALINGTMIHSLEYDDTHTESVVHGSSVLAPAALAVAEHKDVDFDIMIAAFAVGWEFLIRLGLSDPGGLQRRGFQVTAAAGVFAAAAVSSLLSSDDIEECAQALAIAGSMASGTLGPAKRGNSAKAVQAGWAAHSGIMAAELARVGINGPHDVFSGATGFFSLYGGEDTSGAFASAIEDIGTRWLLTKAAFKMYPCCHYIHPFIEAALSLRSRIPDVAELASIHCHVPDAAIPVVVEPWDQRVAIETTQEARWSLPYVLAAVFVDGEVTLGSFRGQPREDVIAIAERIDYEPWLDSGFPRVFPARVGVTLYDGSHLECVVDDVLGNQDRPFTQDDVRRKARGNLASVDYSAERIEAVIALLSEGGRGRVSELSRLLRTSDA